MTGLLKKRDGPLPEPVGACAALLLVVGGAVGEEVLRAALPLSAHLLPPPPAEQAVATAKSSGSPHVLSEDVLMARRALADMVASATPAGACKDCCL